MSAGLSGKNVVVTGSSSGIGRAIALAAAMAGANVLVHGYRNLAGAKQTADEVQALGRQSAVSMADIRDSDQQASLLEAAYQAFPRLDAWVHCAGADILTGESAKLDFQAKLDLLWSIDVRATIQLSRQVAQRLVDQQPVGPAPAMLFVGWDQALHGMEGEAGQLFCPIKGAITSYSLALAQTLAPQVRVNCIAPGWVQTAWGVATDDYWHRRAQASSLMARWGTPDDVATVAAFLISPAASFINGQTIAINGGWNYGVLPRGQTR